MKTSELLKRAEKYLWDGVGPRPRASKTNYLCAAVGFAAPSMAAANRACREIMRRFHPYGLYTDWAKANGHLPGNWRDYQNYWWPAIQANRLNWLRELQREYREKGD